MKTTFEKSMVLPLNWCSCSILIGLLTLGCTSQSRLQSHQTEIDDLKREIRYIKDLNSQYKRELNDLQTKIVALEQNSRKERADFEAQISEIRAQMDAVQSQYSDANYRITALNQQVVPRPPVRVNDSTGTLLDSTGSARQSFLNEESRELYNTAYRDLLRGNYQLALQGFGQFMQQYPNSELTDNAQYWIGEVFYAQGRYSNAVEEFEKVLRNYQKGDKRASATLKIAFAYISMDENEQARLYLDEVIREYPESEEANRAKERLANLK
jgi:tol-pal system protein YbgF